ncbi:type VII secretion target [Jongsikchunia kroppenstedtii]|uniref:type VII secretion target n=1 Tax=Jongsikchunia kroppenstedtii TaxID=1121721 RepID=UPI00035E058D|nr:type VII secretion target [Jongsikchunia kroppenstedtii]
MTTLLASPAAITGLADTAHTLGAAVSASGTAAAIDTTALAAVYGVIGAEFLSAATAATQTHLGRVGSLGAALTRIGDLTATSRDRYIATDDAGLSA